MPHLRPPHKLNLERGYKSGIHTPGWWLLLSWMLESMDADNRNVPIIVRCVFWFDMERCCWKHISEARIELENDNHTLETNDSNLENTCYSIQKGKSEITKGRKGQKNPLSANTEGKQKLVHKREHSWGHTVWVLRLQSEKHIRIWKASWRNTLTFWRGQRLELVRKWKDNKPEGALTLWRR